MIEPTVGRIVWYHWKTGDPSTDPRGQPLAAVVAHVYAGGKEVNLTVSAVDGLTFARTHVNLRQDGEPIEQGECEWMPFQKAASANYSGLEPRIAELETRMNNSVARESRYAWVNRDETATPPQETTIEDASNPEPEHHDVAPESPPDP